MGTIPSARESAPTRLNAFWMSSFFVQINVTVLSLFLSTLAFGNTLEPPVPSASAAPPSSPKPPSGALSPQPPSPAPVSQVQKRTSVKRKVTSVSTVPLQWTLESSGGLGTLVPRGAGVTGQQWDAQLRLLLSPRTPGLWNWGGLGGLRYTRSRFSSSEALTSEFNASYFDLGGFARLQYKFPVTLSLAYRHGLSGKQGVGVEGVSKTVSLVDLKAVSFQADAHWFIVPQSVSLAVGLGTEWGTFQRVFADELYAFSYMSYLGFLKVSWFWSQGKK